MQRDPMAWESLQADEVAELPTRVKERIGIESPSEGSCVVFHSRDKSLTMVLERLKRLYHISSQVTPQESGQQQFERALEWMVASGLGIESDLAVDNFELRSQYVLETPLLSAAQINEMSGLHSKNKSEPASRWKVEGKTLAVRIGGRDLYPEFQFEEGSPRPIMKSILKALPQTMSSWQKAIWFASGNGWLDGAEPQNCLDDGDSVVAAARQLAEPARG